MPRFWSEFGIVQVAERTMLGETYKPDVLESISSKLHESVTAFRPSVLSKAVLISLRRTQDAAASGQIDLVRSRLKDLRHDVEDALMDVPSDAFLWFVLFWVDSAREEGLVPEHLSYLRASYQLGRNEGWIATLRNRVALAIYPVLPPDLAEAATSEFVDLVRSGLYGIAAEILAGPGLPLRHQLLAKLSSLNENDRRLFAGALDKYDLEDATVPGIDLRAGRRPWQH
jgi:hypothetical protein